MDMIDQLIFNIQTLSNLPKNKRINSTKEFLYVEEDSVLQGVNRWYCGESRDRSIQYIIREINLLIEMSKFMMESIYINPPYGGLNEMYQYRISQLQRIYDVLTGAIHGTTNLIYTYDDTNVTAKLQYIQNVISIHLEQINATLQAALSTESIII